MRSTAIIFAIHKQALALGQNNAAMSATHHILSLGRLVLILLGQLPAIGLEQPEHQRNYYNNKNQTTHLINSEKTDDFFIQLYFAEGSLNMKAAIAYRWLTHQVEGSHSWGALRTEVVQQFVQTPFTACSGTRRGLNFQTFATRHAALSFQQQRARCGNQ